MPTYSFLTSLFISIIAASIISTILQLYLLIKSPYYFTKWTIFQIGVVLLLLQIFTITPVTIYGDGLMDQTFDGGTKTLICILQKSMTQFVIYPACLIPLVLAIYQWYAISKNDLSIEKTCFWYFTISIWGGALVYALIIVFVDRNKRFWGTMVTRYYCKPRSDVGLDLFIAGFIALSISLAASLVLVCHSLYVLFFRWKNFEKCHNRLTAIRLGYAIRSSIYIISYICLTTTYIISVILTKPQFSMDGDRDESYYVSDFICSSSGVVLFLIFGTTKSAVFFLPCCYYSPPDEILGSKKPSFVIKLGTKVLNTNNMNDNDVGSDNNINTSTSDYDHFNYFNDDRIEINETWSSHTCQS
nr:12797_t:CDS:2 [Entrophospora candida]